MKFSMTGQEKDDLSIQVIAWAGLTVHMLMCAHDKIGKIWQLIYITLTQLYNKQRANLEDLLVNL